MKVLWWDRAKNRLNFFLEILLLFQSTGITFKNSSEKCGKRRPLPSLSTSLYCRITSEWLQNDFFALMRTSGMCIFDHIQITNLKHYCYFHSKLFTEWPTIYCATFFRCNEKVGGDFNDLWNVGGGPHSICRCIRVYCIGYSSWGLGSSQIFQKSLKPPPNFLLHHQKCCTENFVNIFSLITFSWYHIWATHVWGVQRLPPISVFWPDSGHQNKNWENAPNTRRKKGENNLKITRI